jgi:hypothetical protein
MARACSGLWAAGRAHPFHILSGRGPGRPARHERRDTVLDVLIAAWLTAATVRELPGQPPVVLAVGRTVPATGGWPDLARTVACRAFAGEVLTYLLVWPPGESESPVPVAFYRETVSCPRAV